MSTIISHSEEETRQIAAKIAKNFEVPVCVCLYGELGSGKTVFSKGFGVALGIQEKDIKSPTYTLVRSYPLKSKIFHHFDFYRINEPDDLLKFDLEEFFSEKNAYVVIEWPERIEALLPKKRLNIYFEYLSPTSRKISYHL
jgi:tRNA threonylcarbamoyladenosine biosynthesis protein TsaE